MLDQDAVIARVVAHLERAGMKLHDLSTGSLVAVIDCAVRELLAEAPAPTNAGGDHALG